MARIGLWIKAESAERREPQPTHLDRPYTVVTTHDLRFAVFYLSFESTVIRGEMYQKRKKQILHVYQKLLERNHLSRGTSPPSSHPGVRRGERRRWSAWVQHLEGRMIPVERRALEWMPSSMTGCRGNHSLQASRCFLAAWSGAPSVALLPETTRTTRRSNHAQLRVNTSLILDEEYKNKIND